jgi:uncharacterized repeat protein (TIGR01451 family)
LELLREERFTIICRYETRHTYRAGMKAVFHRICFTLMMLVGILTSRQGHAQGFGILLGPPPAPVAVNGTLDYFITITNLGATVSSFAVTNTFSSNVSFLAASNSITFTNSAFVTTNGNVLTYTFGTITNNDSVTLVYVVQPLTTGLLTNTIVVTSPDFTNTATTNIVTQIFTAVSDLAVAITGPTQAVITNDFVTYNVAVTNLGPDSAPNVLLTNTLPPGVILRSVSPNSPAFISSGSNLVAKLGTVTAGSGRSFTFNIQPTNVELAAFSASIGASNVEDGNLINNFAVMNINIGAYLPATLTVVTNSTRAINVQNGLLEQNILVSNVGATDIPAGRVVITGLTNQLFNAVGTNNGNPFFYLSAPLPAGQSVTMRMQFFSRKAFNFTNAQLHAYGVPLPNWSPPGFAPSSTNINLSLILKLTNGDILLEFPSTLARTYTIVYSDNAQFSNAMMAPPAVTAPANESFWIDYGPPTTATSPTITPTRFYRVYQNP